MSGTNYSESSYARSIANRHWCFFPIRCVPPADLRRRLWAPFYCPADQKVYIDLQFFAELERRYRAAGDFAQAYVVAHEIGHHVQNQLGIFNQVQGKRGRMSKAEANQISVRTELQADFLAGVWAHHAQKMKNILEPGDLEEALGAASAVGDDRLQKQGQGYVVPDSFTHGTSAQRGALVPARV